VTYIERYEEGDVSYSLNKKK